MSEEMRQEQQGSREAEKKRPLNRFFVVIYYLVSAVAGILHPVTVIGRENLPEHGALLCPNHNSNWDPVLVALKVPVNYRLHIMAKKELFCNRVFDWVLRKLGAFPRGPGRGGHRGGEKRPEGHQERGQSADVPGGHPCGTRG